MMHSKGIYCFIVLINFSLVFVIHCQQTSNIPGQQTGDVSTPSPMQFEKTPLQKGMDDLFGMTNSFLDIVMKQNFYDSTGEFNVKTLIEIVNTTNYNKIREDWQAVVHVFGPFAACIIIGLLFILTMPFVGCCYCCCLCCCKKCGANTKDKSDPKNAKCMRITFSLILVACSTLMLVGAIMATLSGELLHRATENTDNAGFVGRLESNVNNLKTFANKAVMAVQTQANYTVDLGLQDVEREINETVLKVVNTIKGKINATSLLKEAEDLGNASTKALVDLENVNKYLQTLKELQENISKELNSIRNEVNASCNQCNTSGLQLNVNFTGLKNVEDQLKKIKDAQNISQFVNDAKKQFDNVSNTINNQVAQNVNKSKQQVQSIRTSVQTELNKINTTVDPVIKVLDTPLNWTSSGEDLINKIGDYVWYAAIGLSCVLMLTVLFYYLGILFGLCGERPGHDVQCCNRGAGANFILAGSVWGFLFVSLLMLIVILLFTTGGLMYTMACRYLNGGVEGVKTFETLLKDGFKWSLSETLNVSDATISGALTNCKENKGLYTAIYLDKKINLDVLINMTDINDEVRKVANFSITLSNITLLTHDLQTQLEQFGNTSLSNISFNEFLNQTDVTDVTGANLEKFAIDLNNTAAQMESANNTAAANSLRNQSERLISLKNNELMSLIMTKDALGRSIKSLQEKSSLTTQTKALIDGIQHAQDYFNTNATSLLKQALNDTVTAIIEIINSTVNNTIYTVKNSIGRCRPVYDAVQGITDTACITFLNPFNGFWFGLGWALFFFIPSFIFAALLKWLLHKEKPYQKRKENFDSPDPHAYSGNMDDNIPLTHQPNENGYGYPQGVTSNGHYNPGYDHHMGSNWQSSPEGRPGQDEGYGYVPHTSSVQSKGI
ncbi:hypothetical protein CHS0354_001790 [Potamilus streckersoni]|uniref:Prominin-like protein n=1 Tax=Potamilus streckersoni TaxID=2493646 RepID=A0AAE0VPG7_9BIVA|nr:hypothetical protein CHS0354_001790 [Potamilus streckersoni]